MQEYSIDKSNLLGKGSFGLVFEGLQKSTGRKCAFKIISHTINKKQQQKQNRQLVNEIQILKTLKSENIVQIYNVVEHEKKIYIIQQLCDSDLQKKIHQKKLTENEAIQLLTQIVNGYLVLVKQGIIHRDLKPANILLKNGQIKIADFGTAKTGVSKNMMNGTIKGTPYYMSSELLNRQIYSSKCDVWAIGIIFYEMVHNYKPWKAQSPQQLYQNIRIKPLKINQNLSQNTKSFLKRVLQIKQKDRASWDQVFDHPIFKGKFKKYFQNNKHIENKLKMAINQLRMIINSSNLDLPNFLFLNKICSLQTQQLNIAQFKKLLLLSNIQLTEQEIRLCFDNVDSDKNGNISFDEIDAALNRNLKSSTQSKLKFTMKGIEVNQQEKQKAFKKIEQFFIRWHGCLSYKGIKLSNIFNIYCGENKKKMSLQNFKKMMKKQFTEEQLQFMFNQIDVDHSKSVEYQELKRYYCGFNNLSYDNFEKE